MCTSWYTWWLAYLSKGGEVGEVKEMFFHCKTVTGRRSRSDLTRRCRVRSFIKRGGVLGLYLPSDRMLVQCCDRTHRWVSLVVTTYGDASNRTRLRRIWRGACPVAFHLTCQFTFVVLWELSVTDLTLGRRGHLCVRSLAWPRGHVCELDYEWRVRSYSTVTTQKFPGNKNHNCKFFFSK
jgi:hypothetical protein